MVNSSSSFALTIQEFGDINRTFTLQVKWFTKVKDIKDMLHRLTSCLPSTQALFIANSSIPLSQTLTLHDLGIDRAGCTLRLSIISSHSANYYFVLTASSASVEPECAQMLTKVRVALQRQQVPAKTDVLDCTGGVYFMRAVSGKKMAVFKPHDEEQGMPNNPKVIVSNILPLSSFLILSTNFIVSFLHFLWCYNCRATKGMVNMVYENISNQVLDVCEK